MGKKLIIKGANFAQNAIDTTFNPLNWFVNAIDEQSRDIPTGNAVAFESSTTSSRQPVGMISPNASQGMLYYGKLSNAITEKRFSTRVMVSLQTLYNNGYRTLKLTPRASGIIVILYSTTPTTASTNPYTAGQMAYNNSTSQVTIPIASNTYVVFQAKPYTGVAITSSSTITDWLNIEIF